MTTRWDRVSLPDRAFALNGEARGMVARSVAWREMMRDRSLLLSRDTGTLAHGAIAGQAFDGGILSRWTFSRQALVMTPAAARRLDDEDVFIGATLEGEGVHAVGDDVTPLGVGDFIVVDARRAFTSAVTSATGTKGFIHVRKAALRDRLGARHEAAIGIYKAGPALQRLAYNHLCNLAGLVGVVDGAALTMLAGQALDIIAPIVNERRPGVAEPSTHRSGMLFRLKADINGNLRNAVYGLDAAAAALGVTPRYVNALLAREGTSFGRLLLERRLLASRRDLADPRNVHRQVAEIAYDWGFNNASHFGRAFKDRFGMMPREAKAAGAVATILAAGGRRARSALLIPPRRSATGRRRGRRSACPCRGAGRRGGASRRAGS